MISFDVRTHHRSQMVEITAQVRQIVRDAKLDRGIVTVFVPHTTAGITINENADPDVAHDMLAQLELMVPWEQPFYRHGEGNSAAHVKASMMGSSVNVIVESNQLKLGTWQGLWLCEFDGPRVRQVWVEMRNA
jgi:secondary thiamine-phosphate synthase enzyme